MEVGLFVLKHKAHTGAISFDDHAPGSYEKTFYVSEFQRSGNRVREDDVQCFSVLGIHE